MALQNTLENLRFFGNYGPEKREFPCFNGTSKIHEALIKKNDCPQDFTTMWLQRLFPSQSGSFVANQIDSDPIAKQLTPEVIGRVLGRIAADRGRLPRENQEADLEEDLWHILYQGMNPVSYAQWSSTLKAEENKLNGTLKRLQPHKEGCSVQQSQVSPELIQLQQNLNDVVANLGRIKLYSTLGSTQEKNKGKLADFKLLAHTLVGALKESRTKNPGNPSVYPEYLPEQMLLAFLIKRSESKDDLVRFMKGIKEGESLARHPLHESAGAGGPAPLLKDPAFLTDEEKKRQFLLKKWSLEDYHPGEIEKNPEEAAGIFLHHPEKLLFYMMRERHSEKPIPPIISMGKAKHKSIEDAAYKTYSDCGETSLRNFFNVVFYDKGSQKFNADIISELKIKNPGLEFSPGLQDFYRSHSDPVSATNQDVRDDWSACVSNHHGVKYKTPYSTPQCEIKVGVDNFMKVMDGLLFNKNPQIVTKATRSEKLDYLCEILSQSDKKLTWSLEGAKNEAESKVQLNEKDSNVKIQFSINGVLAFSWEVMEGHADFQDLTNFLNSWKRKLGVAFLKTKDPAALNLMPWFASGSILNSIKSTAEKEGSKEPSAIVSLLYSLPFKNDLSLLSVYRLALASDRIKTAPLISLVQRIRAQWPETPRLEIMQGLQRAMADADYPFGSPPSHTLDHPESIYTRIGFHSLAAKFGDEIAKKMGRSWMRQIYGHPLVIGDIFRNAEGPSYSFNFEQAKQACLDLNPPAKRDQVVTQFMERNALLSAARKKGQNNPDLARIHQEHAIDGCYLMSLEEWEVVMTDMGHQQNRADHEQRFIPQFLPNLTALIWTSSEDGERARNAFSVVGSTGDTNADFPIESSLALRCACASH